MAHSWWAFSDRKHLSLILIFIYVYIILYYIYKYFTSLSIKCKINMSLQGILLSYFPGLLLHFPRNHFLTPYISISRIISTFVSNGPPFLLKIVIPKKGHQVRIRRVIRSMFVVQIKKFFWGTITLCHSTYHRLAGFYFLGTSLFSAKRSEEDFQESWDLCRNSWGDNLEVKFKNCVLSLLSAKSFSAGPLT